MQIILKESNQYILRFDRGEEVMEGLCRFAEENVILGAVFSALGAVEKVVLAFYDREKKEYEERIFEEDMEIATVTGNIAAMGGGPTIHAHGSFGTRTLETRSGHIKSMTVAGTCEVSLERFEEIQRAYDEETGLNLLE